MAKQYYDPKNKNNKNRGQNTQKPASIPPPRRTSSQYYSVDSSARQVQKELEVQDAPLPSYKQRKRRVQMRQKAEIVMDVQSKFRKHFLSHVLLVTFFGGLLVVLAVQVSLQYNRTQYENANAELAVLRENNLARMAEIHANLDLETIRIIATEQLGMIVPEEFQTRTLHAPKREFIADVPEPPSTQNSFTFARVRNFFSNLSDRRNDE
ncbi:MAG: hypothetical protein FWE33_06520 [Defluviitaleaceae bacterium]|nr:hypothetical protein [Defluviitaleaceae bacterium]